MAKSKDGKYYVSMTDKFMSGWGRAEGKKNKLVFVADSLDEAEVVARNARGRSDQSYINIHSKKPRYSDRHYLTQTKTKADYPAWYIPNKW